MTNQTESEINEIYEIIGNLSNNDLYKDISPNAIEVAIDFYQSRLRTLQQTEADKIERRFNDSLRLPLGEGSRLLKEAERLRKEYSV